MAFILEIDGSNLRLMPLHKRCMELADVIAPHRDALSVLRDRGRDPLVKRCQSADVRSPTGLMALLERSEDLLLECFGNPAVPDCLQVTVIAAIDIFQSDHKGSERRQDTR
jgi:hypothetical protein